jgi:HK97 family phage major capsid protein/HK97 family phage prohead protease
VEQLDLEVKFAIEDDTGTISGIASPFGGEPDRVGDVIAPGAYSRTLADHATKGSKPLMLWMHNVSEPVGVWTEIREEADGLHVKGRILTETTRGKDAYALLKAGGLNGLSIGYRVKDAQHRAGGGRLLKSIDLYEISLVGIPVSERARITSVKSDTTAAEGAASSNEESMTEQQEAQAAAPDLSGIQQQIADIAENMKGLKGRVDGIEAKGNRPGAVETKGADEGLEVKAFTHFVRHGVESMPAEEVKSLSRSTDSAGGYLAPDDYRTELDRNLVQFSPMRQIARISSTSSAKVLLPGRTGTLTAAWVGETAARTGTQPTYGQTPLDVFEMACYTDISNQLLEDADFDMAAELARDFGEEFGRLEGAAFVDGSGTGEPEGFMTNADITEVTAAGTTLDADDLMDIFHALPTAYAANGTWTMNRTTMGIVRKLKNASGDYLWREPITEGNPATILGRPVVEFPDMPDLAAGASPIAFGDFRAGFRIFDRVGLTILRDPYSQQTNGLVRFHARRRVAGGVTKAEALRKLTMAAA